MVGFALIALQSFALFLCVCSLELPPSTSLTTGSIRHWTSKFCANPIELSQNNQAQLVDITFYFRLSKAIQSGVLEIRLPNGFDASSAECQIVGSKVEVQGNVVYISPLTLKAADDISVTLSKVRNPSSAGGYGPFGFVTRNFRHSQPVDMNLTFGAVAIAPEAKVMTLANVGFATEIYTPDKKVNASGQTLSFATALTENVRKGDVVKVILDPQWKLVQPKCSLYIPSNVQAPFNITTSGCTVTPKDETNWTAQTLYIFGLTHDIDLSIGSELSKPIFHVSGFTNPRAAFPATQFSWTVQVLRRQTNTVVQTGSFVKGPAVDPAVITEGKYEPTWNVDRTKLPGTYKLFMEAEVKLPCPIPSGGSVKIKVYDTIQTGVMADASCFVTSYIQKPVTYSTGSLAADPVATRSAVECSVPNQNEIDFLNLPALTAGTPLRVRIYAELRASGQKSGIWEAFVTWDGTNLAAKTTTPLDVFTVPDSSVVLLIPSFDAWLGIESSSSKYNETGGNNGTQSYGVRLDLKTPGPLQCYDIINLSFPFGQYEQDYRVFIPAPLNSSNGRFILGDWYRQNDIRFSRRFSNYGLSGKTMNLPKVNPADFGNVLGQIQFNLHKTIPGVEQQGAKDGYCTGLSNDHDSSEWFQAFVEAYEEIKHIRWPYVASNPSTKYEFHAEVLDNPDDDPNYATKKKRQPTYESSSGNYFVLDLGKDNESYHLPWRNSKLFTVVARSFNKLEFDNAVCKQSSLGALHRILFDIEIMPLGDAINKNRNYYVDLEFQTDDPTTGWKFLDNLESGLKSGDDFPVYCDSGLSNKTTATLVQEKVGYWILRLQVNEPYTEWDKPAQCYFPMGKRGNGSTQHGLIN